MKKSLSILLTIIALKLSGQVNPTELAQPIVAEGKMLYKSEMASWYGTDLFLEKFHDIAKIGGYFSYVENETPTCIFFSESDTPTVIGTIMFDTTYDLNKAKVNLSERKFTPKENDLYTIRKIAISEINTDTMFTMYKNMNFNLIPLINGSEKKVYILTGPTLSGVVVFGNDYLLTFNKDNDLVLKKKLHNNIIPHYYGEVGKEGDHIVGAMHSHLPETGDFITATDICTLMLYSKFANWETYNVVSEKYLNNWNCETNTLIVVPMDSKEWDRIYQGQEKGNRKRDKRK